MYVFNRTRRLDKPKEFQTVFKFGTRFKATYLVAYAYPKQLSNARLGVIVPKKIVKSSVQRHQVKRIVRESFRLNQYNLKNHDIVILLIKLHPDIRLVRAELNTIWLKINQ